MPQSPTPDPVYEFAFSKLEGWGARDADVTTFVGPGYVPLWHRIDESENLRIVAMLALVGPVETVRPSRPVPLHSQQHRNPMFNRPINFQIELPEGFQDARAFVLDVSRVSTGTPVPLFHIVGSIGGLCSILSISDGAGHPLFRNVAAYVEAGPANQDRDWPGLLD